LLHRIIFDHFVRYLVGEFMKRSLLKASQIIALTSFLIAPSIHAAPLPASCAEALKAFLSPVQKQIVQETSEDVAQVYSRYKLSAFRRAIADLRDQMASYIRVRMSHPYPIMVADDFPFAYTWAQRAVGKVSAECDAGKALGDLAVIHADLAKTLQLSVDFANSENETVERAVNIALQRRILEKMSSRDLRKVPKIEIAWPVWSKGETVDGTLAWRTEYFGSDEQIRITYRQLEKDLDKLIVDAENENFNQVVRIERIRTYRRELLRAMSQNPSVTIPEEFTKFLTDSEALFESVSNMYVKRELRGSTAAYQATRWVQWRAEVKSIFVKQISAIKDNEKLKQLSALIDQIDPAEFERLGLNNLAVDAKSIKTSRMAQYLYIAVGGGGTALGSLKLLYNVTFKDKIESNACINERDTTAYLNCVKKFIESRFPGSFFKDLKETREALDDSGKVQNPEIRAYMADFSRRKQDFEYNRNKQDIILNEFNSELELVTMGSETYLKHLARAPDDATFRATLASDDPHVSYIQFKFSVLLANPSIKSAVLKVINAASPDEETKALLELRNSDAGEMIAVELSRVLDLRKLYLESQQKIKELGDAIKKKIDGVMENDNP
jgi:hypothetical protein